MTRTAIHGSCVSRDTVERARSSYELLAYVARQSLISVDNDATVAVEEEPLASPFQQRMRLGDTSGDGLRRLKAVAQRTDLVLLDLCDERLGVLNVGVDLFVTDSVERRQAKRLEAERFNFGSRLHLALWQHAAARWVTQVQEAAPSAKLLLLAVPWATHTEAGESTPPSFSMTAEEANKRFAPYYEFLSGLGVATIGDALQPVAADDHRWGVAPFHYANDVYDALNELIQRQSQAAPLPQGHRPPSAPL